MFIKINKLKLFPSFKHSKILKNLLELLLCYTFSVYLIFFSSSEKYINDVHYFYTQTAIQLQLFNRDLIALRHLIIHMISYYSLHIHTKVSLLSLIK